MESSRFYGVTWIHVLRSKEFEAKITKYERYSNYIKNNILWWDDLQQLFWHGCVVVMTTRKNGSKIHQTEWTYIYYRCVCLCVEWFVWYCNYSCSFVIIHDYYYLLHSWLLRISSFLVAVVLNTIELATRIVYSYWYNVWLYMNQEDRKVVSVLLS